VSGHGKTPLKGQDIAADNQTDFLLRI